LSWSRKFDDPIVLPDGRAKLPKAEHKTREWQTAGECLIGAAEGRDFLMHARIGMLRALNQHVERVYDTDRKATHWGKRKLKRDQ
jgi:hypothetical protein